MPRRLTYKAVKKYIESEGYTLISDSYVNNRTKILIQCPEGHKFEMRFGHFKDGVRCSYCAGNIRYSYKQVEKYINQFKYKLISDEYKNANSKLLIKCPEGHEYNVKFGSFKSGNRCLVCSGKKKLSYKELLKNIEIDGYRLLSKYYKNSKAKLSIQCDKGHEFQMRYNDFQQGVRCPVCDEQKKTSKGEKQVAQFVESLGINIVENDRTQIINPSTGYNLELDIWMPDMNKAIEYNGTYWHSNIETQKRDQIKIDECDKKGINLLVVTDDEWINTNKECKDNLCKFLRG